MANTLIQVRVDEELKNQASEIYEALGLDLSSAIRMFLKRSIIENGIPFSTTLPKDINIYEENKNIQQNEKEAVHI